MKSKRFYAALILSSFIGMQTVPVALQAQEQIAMLPIQQAMTVNKDAMYLDTYFEIDVDKACLTQESFVEALEAITNKDMSHNKKTEALTQQEAVYLAVIAADFEELAGVYTEEKVVAKGIDKDAVYSKYIACAVDTGLITQEAIGTLTDETLTAEKAAALLMAVADVKGLGSQFLGYTNDPAIYGKVINAFEAAILFDNEKLETIGSEAVKMGVTTGYNLINSRYSANFLPDYTLRYGHSSIEHAVQLIGLLNSEGIVAKVQVEPKTSVFQYLPEWGPYGEPTPSYRVDVYEDNLMLASALEYDLVLEFETEEDKINFDHAVEAYAKKNDDNKGEGLIRDSWWQPLYVSTVEMGEGYEQIYNNVITDGVYTLNPFALVEDKESVYEGFKAIDASIVIDQKAIWCNEAFYRYLSGTSHQ